MANMPTVHSIHIYMAIFPTDAS